MDREKAKQWASSILGLSKGEWVDGARPENVLAFDRALPATLLEARKALMANRQVRIPVATTPGPDAAEETDIAPPEGAPAGKAPLKAEVPPEPDSPLPFLDEVGLPPIEALEDPVPAKVEAPAPPPPPTKPPSVQPKAVPVTPAPADELSGLVLDAGDLEMVKASSKPEMTKGKRTPGVPDAPRETAETMGLRNLFGSLRDESKSAFDDLLGDLKETPSPPLASPEPEAEPASSPTEPDVGLEAVGALEAEGTNQAEAIGEEPGMDDLPGKSAEENLLDGLEQPDPLGALDLGDLGSAFEEKDSQAGVSAGGEEEIPALPDFDEEEPAPLEAPKPKARAKAPAVPEVGESSLSDDDILALTGAGGTGGDPAAEQPAGDDMDLSALSLPEDGEGDGPVTAPEEGSPGADASEETPELPEILSEDPEPLEGSGPGLDLPDPEPQPVVFEEGAHERESPEAPEGLSAPAARGAAFSVPDAKAGEDPRLREAFIYLKTFGEANRRIVYDAITAGHLSPRETDLVFRDLVEGREEESLIRWIYDRLVEKNKLAPSSKLPSREKTEFVLLKANFWPLARLALLGLVAVTLLTAGGIWVGKKWRAGVLYGHGIADIEQRKYPEAEGNFNRAFELSPSVKQARRYAERYIARGRFVDAEEKYRLALTLKPEDFETLLDWARLAIRKEDYPDAVLRLKKLDKEGKGPDVVREEWVRALVEWGRKDSTHYGEADKMLNTLLLRHPKSLPYMARKMQVASLEGKYTQARQWHTRLQTQKSSYVDGEMFGDYLELLVDRYQRAHTTDPLKPGSRTAPAGYQDDQLYLVRTIEKTGRSIYGKTKEDIALYWNMARWKKLLGEGPKARRWAEEGVATYERLGTTRNFQASRLYTLLGDLLMDEGKVNDGAQRYTTALEMDPENAMAHYRMGRLQLEQLDKLSNAFDHFQTARVFWKDPEGLEYAGLLHGLSFTSYFLDGGLADETAETPARSNLTQALRYWTELRDAVGPNYLVDYALGAVYVRMGEPQLAWGVQSTAIQDLSKHLKEFHDNVNYVSRDLRLRMEILSDLYNNQAVAELAMADRGRDRDLHRRSAARLLIDSIELKERLGIVRGAPTANFYNLRGAGRAAPEAWRLSDARIPKRLDFRSGQTR